ncbi:MAG: response regulator [Planctomycetota bacterium]|nr:response regulator [Planctomycetota bacterium]
MNSETVASPPSVLFVSRDLMFESKVTGAAVPWGVRVDSAMDASSAKRVAAPNCRAVLFDLSLGLEGLPALVEEFQTQRKIPVIAFGSHVATALLEGASAAGCQDVMPRSRFNATLPELLGRLLREG